MYIYIYNYIPDPTSTYGKGIYKYISSRLLTVTIIHYVYIYK